MSKPKFKFIHTQGRAIKQTEDKMQYFPNMWKDEFPLIRNLGFYGIEWIYDKKSEYDNPILNESGRAQMMEISQLHNISLENVVLDWFISYPLLLEDKFTIHEKIEKLISLIDASTNAGFKRIILPLLEDNNICSNDKKLGFMKVFEKISKHLESNDIELHLETSLPPEEEYSLVKELNHSKVRICFDMGNSASYGYAPYSTVTSLRNFLGSVHIKDRIVNGSSVPLGMGAVKFHDVFSALRDIKFDGPYSFQVYRNKDSDDVSLLKNSLTFINTVISKVYNV